MSNLQNHFTLSNVERRADLDRVLRDTFTKVHVPLHVKKYLLQATALFSQLTTTVFVSNISNFRFEFEKKGNCKVEKQNRIIYFETSICIE